MVKLESEPVLRPAQDIPPPINRTSSTESLPSNIPPRSAQAPQAVEAKPKRSLVQRINPLNLFRSDPKPATRTTPLPPPATSPYETTAPGIVSAPDQGSLPSSTDAAISRYVYLSPAKATPGNHSEAERSFTKALQAQQMQHFPEALQAYSAATKLDPAYFEAYYNLGLAASAAGELSTALG